MATVDKMCPGTSARQDANGHEGVASFTDSLEMEVGLGSVATLFLSVGSLLSVHDRDVGQHRLRRAPGQVRGCLGPGVGEKGQVDLQVGTLFAPLAPDPLPSLTDLSFARGCRQTIHR